MNTECIFLSNTARTDKKALENLAVYINKLSDEMELYPVALSRITTETKCYPTYDQAAGWAPKNKKTTILPGDLVLFVAGKYHYMSKQTLRRYANQEEKNLLSGFTILFPAAEKEFFEDINNY